MKLTKMEALFLTKISKARLRYVQALKQIVESAQDELHVDANNREDFRGLHKEALKNADTQYGLMETFTEILWDTCEEREDYSAEAVRFMIKDTGKFISPNSWNRYKEGQEL